MLEYLRDYIGLSVNETVWHAENKLPRYLRHKRHYSVLEIENARLLLVHVKESEFSIQSFIKQLDKLKEYWSEDIVLVLDRLSAYQRKALIQQKQAFIVPSTQFYIPRLGIALQETQAPSILTKKKQFSGCTQFIFLYLLYHSEEFPMTKTELAQRTSSNAMTITRAIQEMSQFGLAHCERRGRSDYVSPACTGKALWEKSKPYLINPVRDKVYVQKNDTLNSEPISGEEALSELSMLSPPPISVRAIDRKVYKAKTNLTFVNPSWEITTDYTQLEIWSYDPRLHSHNGYVDLVSLYASFKDSPDERVEEAIDEIMEAHKW